jgi:3-methyladenine DNA glycosylase AlkD
LAQNKGSIASRLVSAQPSLLSKLLALTKSENVWHRRFALATAAALNQKGRTLATLTLRVCEPLLADTHPMIRKAVGWAIREACKSDPDQVFAFLSARKGTLAKGLLREASAKLTAAQRKTLFD